MRRASRSCSIRLAAARAAAARRRSTEKACDGQDLAEVLSARRAGRDRSDELRSLKRADRAQLRGATPIAIAYVQMGRTDHVSRARRASRAFGAWLQTVRGCKKGDRVAIMLPNVLQYPIALFGALRAGLTVVNTNPLYTAPELEHQLTDSGATAIVILENFAHVLQEVIAHTPGQARARHRRRRAAGVPEVRRSSTSSCATCASRCQPWQHATARSSFKRRAEGRRAAAH